MSKHIPPSNSKQFQKKKKKKSAVVGVTGKRRIFSGKLISLITKIQNNKNNLQELVALPFLKPNRPTFLRPPLCCCRHLIPKNPFWILCIL